MGALVQAERIANYFAGRVMDQNAVEALIAKIEAAIQAEATSERDGILLELTDWTRDQTRLDGPLVCDPQPEPNIAYELECDRHED